MTKSSPQTWTGRVAVVTGGARGIGAAVARELAARGVRVAIGDVDLAEATGTATAIGGHAGHLDVSDPDSWTAFLAEVESTLGPPDVLVNNAGLMPIGPFIKETNAITDLQLDVNIRGVLLGCRAVLPGMLERQRGHLINIASQAGKIGAAGGVTYCATKWAVVGLSHALDDELRDTPISVTAVLPGIVRTELSAGLPETRLAPRVDPADIARAIAEALDHPKREVWVPRSGRATMTLTRIMPTRLRANLMRLLRLDDPLLHADHGARAGYEARAASAVDDGAVGSPSAALAAPEEISSSTSSTV